MHCWVYLPQGLAFKGGGTGLAGPVLAGALSQEISNVLQLSMVYCCNVGKEIQWDT